MKHFILLSALPGNGKSTWARTYKNTHKNVFIVSSDEIRKELTGEYQNHLHERDVWDTFMNRIHEFGKMEDVVVIADATNLTDTYRKMYHEATPEFDKHTLVLFNKSWERITYQNAHRRPEKVVPDYAMEKLKAEWQYPSDEIKKLYDEFIEIDDWFDAVPSN